MAALAQEHEQGNHDKIKDKNKIVTMDQHPSQGRTPFNSNSMKIEVPEKNM